MLTGREYWVTVNRLIATCLDEDVYQTVASFIPDNYGGLEELNLVELLRNIEARLVTADQLKFKRLRFELLKQTSTENPWRFENRLRSYYRSAQINDESRLVDIYKKGVRNHKLRKLLLLHEPALTTMEDLKAVINHYQTSLLKYARPTPNLPPSAMAWLGSMQCESTDQKKNTL